MGTISETVNPFVGITPAQMGESPEHLFAVVSWGAAATMWLAKALNSHPEILCRHAGNLSLQRIGSTEPLDGVEYLWSLVREGAAYRVVGDAHGISRFAIPAARDEFGDDLSVAVVVREPMSRLASELAHFEWFKGLRVYDVDYVDQIIADRGVRVPDVSYDTKLFVHAVNMLNAIVEERDLGPVFKSEEVTRDARAFTAFVEALTAGCVEVDRSWVDSVLRMPRVNKHARAPLTLTAWQFEVVRAVVTDETAAAYSDLGYPSPVAAASRLT